MIGRHRILSSTILDLSSSHLAHCARAAAADSINRHQSMGYTILSRISRDLGPFFALIALLSGNAWATAAQTIPAIPTQCKSLESLDLSGLQDAPSHIVEATPVEATGSVPAHCRVRGYILPQVGFELNLPAESWNGKFIEMGCGGFCGSIDDTACKQELRRGYACIASDAGHKGEDGLWAYNNLQAKIDWGYRAAHVTALAGKSITARYYARRPSRSYFNGCSTGGRQGMVEAERFPWDFDGIIAGAPPINFTANSMTQLWSSLAAKDQSGKSILSAHDVQVVHKAVLAKCDLDDGLRDGILDNPKACKFDPAVLECREGKAIDCLTKEQI